MSGWRPTDATKDSQSVTADWESVGQQLIDGVLLREVRNVPKENGFVTELLRHEWFQEPLVVAHVFQVTLESMAVSAWHAHEHTTDRLFVSRGMVKIVLYDARQDSPTFQTINEFRFGSHRPALVVVPPKVWHGVQNLSGEPATLINMTDRAYAYTDPDHWRLPVDTPEIPYRIGGVARS